jgi:hypothetical protein
MYRLDVKHGGVTTSTSRRFSVGGLWVIVIDMLEYIMGMSHPIHTHMVAVLLHTYIKCFSPFYFGFGVEVIRTQSQPVSAVRRGKTSTCSLQEILLVLPWGYTVTCD